MTLPIYALEVNGAELSRVTVLSKDAQSHVEIVINANTKPRVFLLTEGGKRLVIDLPQVKYGAGFKTVNLRTQGIKGIRHAQKAKGLRVVVDLSKNAKYLDYRYDGSVLTFFIENGTFRRMKKTPYPRLKPNYYDHVFAPTFTPALTSAVVPVVPSRRRVASVSPPPQPKRKNTMQTSSTRILRKEYKPMIVIDPGHGGRDPGAIGQKHVKEETVTLKAALELKRQLMATGKYRVILTRSSDVYVDLDKRVLITRKASADLFISLHADSLAQSKTRGASVYTLASRAEGRGQRIVNTQNWILDVDLSHKSSAVSDILVDLAQRKAVSRSGQFAKILIPQLRRKTKLLANTHREAGYYVLLAPDVPAVLLEMGYISNLEDEALLNSAAHRKKLMQSVSTAIDVYFRKQIQLQAEN